MRERDNRGMRVCAQCERRMGKEGAKGGSRGIQNNGLGCWWLTVVARPTVVVWVWLIVVVQVHCLHGGETWRHLVKPMLILVWLRHANEKTSQPQHHFMMPQHSQHTGTTVQPCKSSFGIQFLLFDCCLLNIKRCAVQPWGFKLSFGFINSTIQAGELLSRSVDSKLGDRAPTRGHKTNRRGC